MISNLLPVLDEGNAVFRVVDLTMTMALQADISLEEATLILISRFEEHKNTLSNSDREIVTGIMAKAVQQLHDLVVELLGE